MPAPSVVSRLHVTPDLEFSVRGRADYLPWPFISAAGALRAKTSSFFSRSTLPHPCITTQFTHGMFFVMAFNGFVRTLCGQMQALTLPSCRAFLVQLIEGRSLSRLFRPFRQLFHRIVPCFPPLPLLLCRHRMYRPPPIPPVHPDAAEFPPFCWAHNPLRPYYSPFYHRRTFHDPKLSCYWSERFSTVSRTSLYLRFFVTIVNALISFSQLPLLLPSRVAL